MAARLAACALALALACLADASGKRSKCNQIPEPVLSEILGPAFNSRYMSIEQPPDVNAALPDTASHKRAPVEALSFYVEDDYSQELSEQPAWTVRHHEAPGHNRHKRSVLKSSRQWECESKIKWTDLGPDYFPRYLRSVECTSKTCWYDMLKCKPRSFTVKILKRRTDRCVPDEPAKKTGVSGLPRELRELWVWEEHAVNFCCDCSA